MTIELQRVYGEIPAAKGYRILVDRVWPRGVSKASLALDEWCREVAPSTELRRWFAHDPQHWDAFQQKYRLELKTKKELLQRLRTLGAHQPLILLYGARDQERNQAVVLREVLLDYSSNHRV